MNREQRIVELAEKLDYDAVRKFVNVIGDIVNVEDDKSYHQLLKLIDSFQELESVVTGVPIK